MTEDWRPHAVAICVPVRDEAALLPAFLDAVARQSRAVPATMCPVTLCIAFDACTDASERIVRERSATMPCAVAARSLPGGEAPDAGRARRAALALGESVLGKSVLGKSVLGGATGALLTTDADGLPASGWVAAAVRALGMADVAAGHIARDDTHRDPVQDRVEAYYDRLFALRRTLDPVPWEAAETHHYTGGANLAFRAEAYAALGGFRPRPSGEDAAIVDEAHRAGLRVRRDAGVRVTTSSRRTGRALGGLADHLRSLAGQAADAVRMAHPEDAAWQYRGHAAARAAFGGLPDLALGARLAVRIAVPLATILDTAAASPNAEAFAMRVVPGAPSGERLVMLDEAELALAAIVARHRERAA